MYVYYNILLTSLFWLMNYVLICRQYAYIVHYQESSCTKIDFLFSLFTMNFILSSPQNSVMVEQSSNYSCRMPTPKQRSESSTHCCFWSAVSKHKTHFTQFTSSTPIGHPGNTGDVSAVKFSSNAIRLKKKGVNTLNYVTLFYKQS